VFDIRAALLRRAVAQGHVLERDADLRLLIDGEAVLPCLVGGSLYRFDIPTDAASVWLASRASVPAEVVTGSRDVRRLGVPVELLALRDANLSIEASHGHVALCQGFHEDESSHRWTNGVARIPEALLRPFPGALTLDVHLLPSELPYWAPSSRRQLAIEDEETNGALSGPTDSRLAVV